VDSNTNIPTELWTVREVAQFLRVPISTLYQWRYFGSGPSAYRVGKHLRYNPADVWAWLNNEAA
jgi:excisionase family DNA binding protein